MSEEEQKHLQQSYYDLHEKYYKQKREIERLDNENEMLKEAVKEKVIATCNTCEDYGICPHSYREYDLNNIIKAIKGQLNYLETYSSKEDAFEDMKRRLDRIESIVNRK